MTDLISADQVTQIRTALNDVAETFGFPVTLKQTSYTAAAFQSGPTVVEHNLIAIRDYAVGASNVSSRFRNPFGPTGANELDLFLRWVDLEAIDLIDADNKPLIDLNDLIEMEGEIYELLQLGGIGDMTKKPIFLQVRVKRRFANPNGAASV